MIEDLNNENIEQVNELLKEFNYSLNNELNNFVNVLVYETNEVLGVLVYKTIYERIEIDYIVVNDKYRNTGIGTKLIKEMLNRHKDIGNITLEVRKSNEIAIKFYEKMGFNKVAIRKNYYNDEDGFLMLKKIGE